MVPLEQLMNTSANIAQTIKDGHKKKKNFTTFTTSGELLSQMVELS